MRTSLLFAFLFLFQVGYSQGWQQSYDIVIQDVEVLSDNRFLVQALDTSDLRIFGLLDENGILLDTIQSIQKMVGPAVLRNYALENGQALITGNWGYRYPYQPDNIVKPQMFQYVMDEEFNFVYQGYDTISYTGHTNLRTKKGNFFIVTGSYNSSNQRSQLLMKLNSDLQEEWSNWISPSFNSSSSTSRHYWRYVQTDDDGLLLAVEQSYNDWRDEDEFEKINLKKIDSLGQVEWEFENEISTYISGEYGFYILPTGNDYYMAYQNQLWKFDKNGVLKWKKLNSTILPYGADRISKMIAGENGSVLIQSYFGDSFFLTYIDQNGNVIWTKQYGVSNVQESVLKIQKTPDGGFILLVQTVERRPALVVGTYLLKIDPSGSFNQDIGFLKTKCFLDLNDNARFDLGEPTYKDLAWYLNSPDNFSSQFRPDSLGENFVRLEPGDFQISIDLDNYFLEPVINDLDILIVKDDTLFLDLPIKKFGECPLMTVDLGTPFLRRCFPGRYSVCYCNAGNASAQDVTVKVELDPFFTDITCDLPFTFLDSSTLLVEIGNVEPSECGDFKVDFTISCDSDLGQEHCSQVSIFPDTVCVSLPDFEIENPFVEEDCRINRGSYDPNDKQELYGRADGYVEKDSLLKYYIRFQNTGTDTAFRVFILDTISSHLDLATLVEGASSHPYELEYGDNGTLKFFFDDILLVDSFTNEPLSHGFVQFKIAPKKGLPRNTKIENRAHIFFDFNDPITTNTVEQKVAFPKRVNIINRELCDNDPRIFGNWYEVGNYTIWDTIQFPEYDSISVYNLKVLPAYEFNENITVAAGEVINGIVIRKDTSLKTVYRTHEGCDSIYIQNITTTSSLEENSNKYFNSIVVSNPFSEELILKVEAILSAEIQVDVINVSGQVVLQSNPIYINQGSQYLKIGSERLNKGIYFIRIRGEGFQIVAKAIKG